MTLAALAFAAGAALLQLQAVLPSLHWGWCVLVFPLIVIREKRFLVPAALATGFLWASTCAHWRLAERLAPELEGRDLEVVGVVASLPSPGERGVRFEFDLESSSEPLPKKALLFWYGPAEVHPGERWLLTVRLRRPHGLVNPHGFDYEAYLLERGIGATGYVHQRGEQRRLGFRRGVFDAIESLREGIRDRFRAALGATPAAGILAALAV